MEVGDRVGPWRLEALLGRGSTSQVFRASDPDGRVVALKCLTDGVRAAREADTLRELHGPGIPRLVDSGSDADAWWLALEWIRGSTLAAALREDRMSVPAVLQAFEALASTLARIHDAGFVHGDVNPSHVVLVGSCVVLLDLGTAARLGADGTVEVREGTPGYQPLEQLDEGKAGPAGDIYAFGECLAESLEAMDAPPPALRTLADACRADDPSRRPPSASLIAGELMRIHRNPEVAPCDTLAGQLLGIPRPLTIIGRASIQRRISVFVRSAAAGLQSRRVLILEGPAGSGRSTLLAFARQEAAGLAESLTVSDTFAFVDDWSGGPLPDRPVVVCTTTRAPRELTPSLRVVRVPPFGEGSIVKLIQHEVDLPSVRRADAHFVLDHSGGAPARAMRLLKAWSRTLRQAGTRPVPPLPQILAGANAEDPGVRAALRLLPPGCRLAAELIAWASPAPVPASGLAATSGIPVRQLRDALTETVSATLGIETDGQAVRMRDDVTARLVRDLAAEDVRGDLADAAAGLLVADLSVTALRRRAELSWPRQQGEAVLLAWSAARRLFELDRSDDMPELGEMVLVWAERMPPPSADADIVEAVVKWLSSMGRHADARALVDRADPEARHPLLRLARAHAMDAAGEDAGAILELCEPHAGEGAMHSDPDLQLRAASLAAHVSVLQEGDFARAANDLASLRLLADEASPRIKCRWLRQQAGLRFHGNAFDDARRLLEESARLAQEFGLGLELAECAQLATLFSDERIGGLDRRALIRDGLEAARRRNDFQLMASIFQGLATARLQTGETDAGARAARQAIWWAQRHSDARGVRNARVDPAAASGGTEGARADARVIRYAREVLARVMTSRGDLAAASRLLRQAEFEPDRVLQAYVDTARADIALLRGSSTEAAEHLAHAAKNHDELDPEGPAFLRVLQIIADVANGLTPSDAGAAEAACAALIPTSFAFRVPELRRRLGLGALA